jgi:hypothetical protein
MPDYTVGVSAGMAYGVSYLSQQKRRNLKLLMHYANDRRYMGLRNWINPRNRCYFGLEFAYETIPNRLVPFDYDTFAPIRAWRKPWSRTCPPGGPPICRCPGGMTSSCCSRHLRYPAAVSAHCHRRRALS